MLVTRHWFHVNRCIKIIMYITSQSRSSWKLNNKSITVHILRIISDGDAPIRRSNWVLLANLLLFAIKLIVLFRFQMKSIPFALTKTIVWLNVVANSIERACLFFKFPSQTITTFLINNIKLCIFMIEVRYRMRSFSIFMRMLLYRWIHVNALTVRETAHLKSFVFICLCLYSFLFSVVHSSGFSSKWNISFKKMQRK